jgi:AhpD family alkylhydroperoxidase
MAASFHNPAPFTMKTIQIYDSAMCCSTGVCGPQVDPVLVRFAGNLKWLQNQGVEVHRFNLSQNPAAYVENELVKAALTEKGEAALPLVLVDGKVIASGQYPEREQLAAWSGLETKEPSLFSPAVAELVAIGAAIASNCEPCLRHHVREAEQLGVTAADIARAVAMAAKVKDAPHRNIMRQAARLTQTEPAAAVTIPGACLDGAAAADNAAKGPCCS